MMTAAVSGIEARRLALALHLDVEGVCATVQSIAAGRV
jgi:hypothetical protein